jgi:glucose dehydrogenase
LYEGKVIAPVIDGRLRALDMETGQVLWETRVSPDDQPYTITMAPRVIAGGRVIIGVSGGEYGVRGFFDAYDVDSGEQIWRFYTVPDGPTGPFENDGLEEAAATWDPGFWELGIDGGAPVWNGMAYDEEADLVYIGTGQPAPWTSAIRGPGDNLFTNTILAVRGVTGRLVWHYQTTPGDDWDYDSIADIMLAELEIGGRERKVLMHAPKNGFFYVLDRHTGELLGAEPWVTVSWALGIDMTTGRPTVNPEARYGTESVQVTPGPGGGHVWPPWSFNPNTGLVYIPSTIGGGYSYAAAENFEANPAGMNMGTSFGGGGRGRGGRGGRGATPGLDTGDDATDTAGVAAPEPPAPAPPPPLPRIGPTGRGNILSAWDPVSMTERWRAQGGAAGFNQGGTLATGGNLVFSNVSGNVLAYHAESGELLLELPTALNQMGPPMTFMVDGVQYLAVAGGPPGGGGRGRGGAPQADAAPPQPSRLVALRIGGSTPLPGVTVDEEEDD